jgi:diguanylate cyclase (GGDEF)-like protein
VDSQEFGQQINKSYLEQFNFLQKTGALDDLSLLRNENRVLDTLINDAAKLYALKSVEDIMDFVIDRVLQQFIPTYFLVAIEPPRGHDLLQYCYANMKPSDERLSAAAYEALKRQFLTSPYLTNYKDIELDAAIREELARFEPELAVPLCGIEGAFGFALYGRKVLGEPYTEVELMYIDKFTRFISIGIQNNLNRASAITDPKTGLYNNAYFMRRLEQEIAHVMRHDARAGIIMIDVDHFKKFNDTWGHLAGDEVLNALARTLQRTVRTEDVASRFGGEEFCILAIECNASELREMAERIRLAIAALAIPYKSELLTITASFGCCVLDRDLRAEAKDYVDMADKALYLSKSGGRNRSTLYRPGLLDKATAIRKRAV